MRWDGRQLGAYTGAPDNGMWIPERGLGDTGRGLRDAELPRIDEDGTDDEFGLCYHVLLALTRYCHHQYCMVYSIKGGGRWCVVYCAIDVQ